MTRRASRLQDVARVAGVSFITAWRALNSPELVRDQTIARVRHAAEELGYVANAVARSLVTSTSKVVAVVVPSLDDSIFAATVEGISTSLAANSMELLIGLSNYDEVREEELVRAFLGRQIDGLILTGHVHASATRKLLNKVGVPVVEMWDLPDDPIDMSVGFSNIEITEFATNWLIGKGYRRIGFVAPFERPRAQVRLTGFRRSLEKNGFKEDPRLIVAAEPTLDGGAYAFDVLASLDEPPDAVFFNGDQIAVGAMFCGLESGWHFPKDMALLGLHDTAIASHIRPALSTVRIPRYEIGVHAADLLLARFADPDALRQRDQIDVGFEVVERQTT